jgi:hypothetical protein
MAGLSRYEINQKVRASLVRHGVDMLALQYSCTQGTVYLYGALKKEPMGDFSVEGVEALAIEISRIPEVKFVDFRLDNWEVSSDYSGVHVTKKKAIRATGEGPERHINITSSERIQDIIKEMAKKGEKKDKPGGGSGG